MFKSKAAVAVLSLFVLSTSAMAWDETYSVSCRSSLIFAKTSVKLRFSLIHPETDAITGVREPEATDPFAVLERKVESVSGKVEGKELVKASLSDFEVSSEGLFFKIAATGVSLALTSDSENHSTDPNFVAEKYSGTISFTKNGKTQETNVTCKVSEELSNE